MDFGTPKQSHPAAAAGLGAAGSGAKETSTAEFANDVLTASRDAVVIVDFYSGASPQCKQSSAALESAVRPHAKSIRLVKLNIDKHPAIAGQLKLQTVPTVYAFRDGRPIDGFAGVQPDDIVKQFVDGLVGANEAADLETVLVAANETLDTGDLQGAAEIFASVLQADPQNVGALAGLAQCYVKSGDVERAGQTIALVPPDKQNVAAVQAVIAALDLAGKADEAGDTSELEAKVAANPADHQSRFDLAVALGVGGDKGAAIGHLIELISRDRKWNEDAARKQLLQFFEAWGPKDEATQDGRRKLSSVLFS